MSNDNPKPRHLFEAVGVEVEYMIVDRKTLDVRPLAAELLRSSSGEVVNETVRGPLGWSNELASHVIEFKTLDPVEGLVPLVPFLVGAVTEANEHLKKWNAELLPTAMHPFMDPETSMQLWPYGDTSVYQAFDRIFGCRGHGFSNLQSIHINLPFSGDDEFARLHAAIRLVLPVIPCLAASSPFKEGISTGWADTRLEVYRTNQKAVPEIAGQVIPERVFTQKEYETGILGKVYQAIAPLDPEGRLRHEWLNSRGAIARFDRNAIEIRLVDTQECPRADLAVVSLVVAVCKALVYGRFEPLENQKLWDEKDLAGIFLEAVKHGGKTQVTDPAYLKVFGAGEGPLEGRLLWKHLHDTLVPTDPTLAPFADVYKVLFSRGTLAERLVKALPEVPSRKDLKAVCTELARCLAHNQMFV